MVSELCTSAVVTSAWVLASEPWARAATGANPAIASTKAMPIARVSFMMFPPLTPARRELQRKRAGWQTRRRRTAVGASRMRSRWWDHDDIGPAGTAGSAHDPAEPDALARLDSSTGLMSLHYWSGR